jgi:putative transposase
MHPYPKHLDAFDYRGRQRYFLTFCTHNRQPYFRDAVHVALVVVHFLRAAIDMKFAVLAYCFMPDHLHTVVEGRSADAELKMFVARAKQYSGFYFKKQVGMRLWQRYGHEHVIRDDEPTRKIVRYVLENPLRAGLAQRVADYPFIGSTEYTVEELLEFCTSR